MSIDWFGGCVPPEVAELLDIGALLEVSGRVDVAETLVAECGKNPAGEDPHALSKRLRVECCRQLGEWRARHRNAEQTE